MLLTLKNPSPGQPALVKYAPNASKITFNAVVAATQTGLDIKTELTGRLFLQSLDDTQTVLHRHCQPELTNICYLFNRSHWPTVVKQDLIPVVVESAKATKKADWKAWHWKNDKYEKYAYEYAVKLSIATKNLENVLIPQLFNLLFTYGNAPRHEYDIRFHAVYIHNQAWDDFCIAQITDTHLSWRNEIIVEEILKCWHDPIIKKWQDGKVSTVYPAGDFINFNENLRTFIRYANALHRRGELDLILLTGDIVDYIEPYRRAGDNPWNNFDAFLDIVTALPRFDKKLVDAELEVPVFTMLGNHDYRPEEYPLIAKYKFEVLGVTLYQSEQFSNFGLGKEEACLFETGHKDGIKNYTQDAGLKHVLPIDHVPEKYRALINPDADYSIRLGSHRIVCLDSAHDEGAVTGIWDYFINHHESRNDFIAGSPDSSGLTAKQLGFLKTQLKGTKGRAIVALHAPWVNIHGNTPFHMMRESERKKLGSDANRGVLFKYMLRRGFTAVQDPDMLGFLHDSILTKQQRHQSLVTIILSCLEFSQGSTLLQLFIKSWLTPAQCDSLEQNIYDNELKDKMSGHIDLDILVSGLTASEQQAKFFYVVKVLFTQAQRLKFVSYVIINVVKPWQAIMMATKVLRNVVGAQQAGKAVTLLMQQGLLDTYMTQEWSYDKTPYFKRGNRDPYLGKGVTDHGFVEFLKIATQQVGPDNCVDLVLTGHTHRSIEYKVDLDAGRPRYYHDYYIDNRIHGKSPQQYWWSSDTYKNNPNGYWANPPAEYKNLLSSTKTPDAWWSAHRPLFVQLLGLGPKPSSEPEGGTLLVRFRLGVIDGLERKYLPEMKQLTSSSARNQAWFYLNIARP